MVERSDTTGTHQQNAPTPAEIAARTAVTPAGVSQNLFAHRPVVSSPELELTTGYLLKTLPG